MTAASKLFISYSRAQTPFVDRLADQLEDQGYSLLLDYQNLVPARPWFEQITSFIDAADVVLLVVSSESINSKNVEPEWKRAVDRGKRILLLIFEAVPLPRELQTCDWVDFRSNYREGFRQLLDKMERPASADSPPPQSGFKAPPAFWASLVLSLITLIGSIPSWWTLVVPYVLAPLPWQIYRRDYSFHRVIPTLLLLPFIYWISWWMMFTSPTSVFYEYREAVTTWSTLSLIAAWLLAGLLLSPDMQRRGLPQAARLRFANPLAVEGPAPRPVRFAIDGALQDARYVEGVRRSLEQEGHRAIDGAESPEAIFVLVSAYKKQTDYDPDRQPVYPILLQSMQEIEPALARIQWIDFRNGIQNIQKLARLLPSPERLLKGLAVPPTGSQEVFPFAVSALQYFIFVTGLLQGGGLLLSLIALFFWVLRGNSAQGAEAQILGVMLNGFLLLGTMHLAARALRSRLDGASTFYPLLALLIFQVSMSLISMLVIALYWPAANLEAEVRLLNMATRAADLNWVVLPVALVIIVGILLLRWRELFLWLPQRQGDSVSPLESWLLLYTPRTRWGLVLHIIFHVLFLLLYALLNLWSIFAGLWIVRYLVFCCLLVIVIMIGIRNWARRLSG